MRTRISWIYLTSVIGVIGLPVAVFFWFRSQLGFLEQFCQDLPEKTLIQRVQKLAKDHGYQTETFPNGELRIRLKWTLPYLESCRTFFSEEQVLQYQLFTKEDR